ncbi:hypothetical protein MferCBS31731_006817 [Microsporum ferrugineum]
MSQQGDNDGPSHPASSSADQPQPGGGGGPTEPSAAPAESSSGPPAQPTDMTDEPPTEPSSAGPSQPSAAAETQPAPAPAGPSTQPGSASPDVASRDTHEMTGAVAGGSSQDPRSRRQQPQAGSSRTQRERQHRGDPPQPRGKTPPIDTDVIAIAGDRGGLMRAPRAGAEPQVYRGILPDYIHPRPIEATKLPLCSLFRQTMNSLYPHLDAFLQKSLDKAFETIYQKVPSDLPGAPYPRPRRSPGCKPKCYFSHRSLIREFDPGWAEDHREHEGIIPDDANEEWFGRKSVHKDSQGMGRASFADMRSYWKDRQTIHLPEYVSGIKVTNVHRYNCEDIKLVNWRDVTAEICWIERSDALISSHRVFAVMVITAARAFDPATMGRLDAELPSYDETADSRPKPIPKPGQNYADIPPEGDPRSSRDAEPAPESRGEAGSSRDVQPPPESTRCEAGISRDVQPAPEPTQCEAGSSRDVQPAPESTQREAGSSRDAQPAPTEPAPIGPVPARGVPEGWLDSLVVVHLPLDHRCIPRTPKEHPIKRTIFPSYVSVGMVRQLPKTHEEERDNKTGKYEWLFALSAKPQSRMPLRWQQDLYVGIPHVIKDEPGEFMRMMGWRRYNDRPRPKSLVRFM